VPAGQVPSATIGLDVLDAAEIGGLLAAASMLAGALAGDPAAETIQGGLDPGGRDLAGLAAELAAAADDLEARAGAPPA
jgi:hypothetical protein